jgi:CRISPR-associated protein Cmr6
MMPDRNSPAPNVRALPQDTNALAEQIASCKNLSLLLDKYQPWKTYKNDQNKIAWDLGFLIQERRQNQWQNRTATGSEAKGHWLSTAPSAPRNVEWLDARLQPDRCLDKDLFQAFRKRWEQLVGKWILIRSRSRLVIGLGGKGTLEMGLTLHRNYGFPYIPGSALKGLTRAAALYELAAKWGIPTVDYDEFRKRKPENGRREPTPLNLLDALIEAPIGRDGDPKRLDAIEECLKKLKKDPLVKGKISKLSALDVSLNADFQCVRAVFGCLGQSGGVVFYDAIPKNSPLIVTEIMNPHFPKYYNKEQWPGDSQDPQPVPYLAVEEGTDFLFAINPRSDTSAKLVEVAWKWLQLGLSEYGIGGKTSSGMGLFGTPTTRRTFEINATPYPGATDEEPSTPTNDIPEIPEKPSDFSKQFMAALNRRQNDDDN